MSNITNKGKSTNGKDPARIVVMIIDKDSSEKKKYKYSERLQSCRVLKRMGVLP